MYKIVEFSHLLIEDYLKKHQDRALTLIDATVGNGQDTLFLAKNLKKGIVIGYDIQEEAISFTESLLKSENIQNTILKLKSHEFISEEKIDLVIFNLGYLPGSDKVITTKKETTKNALLNLINKIKQNEEMLIIIVLYPGHSEGKEESILIDDLLQNLNPKEFLVCKYQNYNRPTSPFVLTVSKNKKLKTK